MYAKFRITGAEKRRSSEGTGFAGTFVKTKRSSACFSESTRSVPAGAGSPSSCSGISAPSGATRPTANGMWNGSFSG